MIREAPSEARMRRAFVYVPVAACLVGCSNMSRERRDRGEHTDWPACVPGNQPGTGGQDSKSFSSGQDRRPWPNGRVARDAKTTRGRQATRARNLDCHEYLPLLTMLRRRSGQVCSHAFRCRPARLPLDRRRLGVRTGFFKGLRMRELACIPAVLTISTWGSSTWSAFGLPCDARERPPAAR